MEDRAARLGLLFLKGNFLRRGLAHLSSVICHLSFY